MVSSSSFTFLFWISFIAEFIILKQQIHFFQDRVFRQKFRKGINFFMFREISYQLKVVDNLFYNQMKWFTHSDVSYEGNISHWHLQCTKPSITRISISEKFF